MILRKRYYNRAKYRLLLSSTYTYILLIPYTTKHLVVCIDEPKSVRWSEQEDHDKLDM
jgi:hypothetical protein